METQPLPDWEALAATVYTELSKAVHDFSQEHPQEICSSLALLVPLSTPYLGTITINFDTPSNSSEMAQRIETDILARRDLLLINKITGRWKWKSASNYTDKQNIVPYNSDVFAFKYPSYRQVILSELETLEEEALPQDEHAKDDYISGNFRILVWKVFKQIVENNDLKPLNLASPFYLGYQLADEDLFDMVILRILNWPK